MIYVTGADFKEDTVYWESCETLEKAADRVDEFTRLSLEAVKQWAVEPSYENSHFSNQYPDTEKIICWDKKK